MKSRAGGIGGSGLPISFPIKVGKMCCVVYDQLKQWPRAHVRPHISRLCNPPFEFCPPFTTGSSKRFSTSGIPAANTYDAKVGLKG